MKIVYTTLKKGFDNLNLIVFSNGELKLDKLNKIEANLISCHIDVDGHDISQEELYNEKNINSLMSQFCDIVKAIGRENDGKIIVMGNDRNAEVALDVLLKENELVDGGVLIKPILNIALTDGLHIEDDTKVLIIGGDDEADEKQYEEQDIADILSVNGYDVTLEEIDGEGEELTEQDVELSISWITKNFIN